MHISVFGGAQIGQDAPHYQQAVHFGNLLGREGYIILNGGYTGLMEAVSRGAAEAGGHVIGVTCKEIEKWRPIQKNSWIKEEWGTSTLLERLWLLLAKSDLAVALPGGIGTLAEISMLWNLQVIEVLDTHPILVVGKGWQSVFKELLQTQGNFIPVHDRDQLLFMKDLEYTYNYIHSNYPIK